MTAPGLTVAERFWLKVDKTDGCWNWTAATNGRNYGRFSHGPTGAQHHDYAHRYSYALHHGPIPSGLHVDHLCRNTLCVNPGHMELVTKAENTRRRWVAERAA